LGLKTDAQGPKQAQPPLERAIAELASARHAVVARSQLEGLGLGARAISHRVQRGMLHRGVYAIGHPLLTREGRWMAAVLTCGGDAVLSHRSAASLWGLRTNARGAIDVTVPTRAGRAREGIDVHRGSTLKADDTGVVDGIPCTSVARTLLDLAEVVGARGLERAVEQAEILRLLDMRPIDDVLARANGRRGAGALRAVLSDIRLGTTLTRSELEERFLAICRSIGTLPDGVNAWIAHPAGGGTSPTGRSSTTGGATSASCAPAGASCASPGARCASSRRTSPRP
jgi:predicted transcriptional regulator of viral defense system